MKQVLRNCKYLVAIGIGGAMTLIAGCSKEVGSGAEAFAKAPAEVKAGWDKAMAAMKTNGYAVATMALMEVGNSASLTAEQKKVLQETSQAITDKMYAGINKDEPAAKAALEQLRAASGR